MAQLTRAQVVSRLESDIDSRMQDVAGFAKQVVLDPLYALESSDRIFRAGAEIEAARRVMGILEKGSWSDVMEYAMDKVLDGASSTRSSTSPTSNVAEAYRTWAWAELVRKYKDDVVVD